MLRSRHAAFPAIPSPVHSDDDVRAWFVGHLYPTSEVWLASTDSEIVAVLVLRADWLDQLYVDAGRSGHGIGTALLDKAKSERDSLDLWTFQANQRARAFYERHGFVEVGRTDGDNEEGAPDLRYHWEECRPNPQS